MGNIHNYEGQLKNLEERIFSNKKLCKKDKEDLKRFLIKIRADGKTAGRILKIMYTVFSFGKFLGKPLRDANKDDVINAVSKAESGPWSDWTKRDFKIIVRMFYKFLRNTEECPPEVAWIKARNSSKRLLPDDIMTEEEIIKLASAATNPRDKAFILCLYESGTRIGEFMGIMIKNISFDEYGAVFRVSGKTGDRRIRIVASTSALKDWLDAHPHKNNPEAYLWIRSGGKNPNDQIQYSFVLDKLRRYAKKAGISKRVNPHAFRHARGTFLANKMTDRQMKEFFGWSKSETISTYTHLSGKDLDEAILKQHGILLNGNSAPSLSSKKCIRCGELNDPTAKLCKKCYFPLDMEDKRQAIDDITVDLLKIVAEIHPEIKDRFMELVKKKGLEGMFELNNF